MTDYAMRAALDRLRCFREHWRDDVVLRALGAVVRCHSLAWPMMYLLRWQSSARRLFGLA